MTHVNEHVLELYVLNSPKDENQRDKIETHLSQCHGCRALVEEMRAFHRDLAEELKQTPIPEPVQTKALAKRKQEIEPYFEPYIPPPVSSNTIVRSFQTFVWYVKNNPIKTVAGGAVMCSMLAGMFYLGMMSKKSNEPVRDMNPDDYNYNTAQNLLEVYNKKNEVIWSLPLGNAEKCLERDNKGHFEVRLADMDGNGTNEILTTMPNRRNDTGEAYHLNIINLADNHETKIFFDQEFQYLDRKDYSFKFNAGMILTEGQNTSAPNILVTCPNILRSPFFLARLDNTGKTIGRYWHFGQLGEMYKLDINRDGTEELVLCGVNDSPDKTNEEFAVFAVLDPLKIKGNTKSTATPGFKMPFSNAEIIYVQFPFIKPRKIFNSATATREMSIEGDDLLHFEVYYHDGDIKETPVTFHFYFTRDMKIKSVKSHNITNRFFEKLYRERKIKTPLNTQFLENLKNGVRYWDGKNWKKEWTMVKHN